MRGGQLSAADNVRLAALNCYKYFSSFGTLVKIALCFSTSFCNVYLIGGIKVYNLSFH